MDRRQFLAATGTATSIGLAGCTGVLDVVGGSDPYADQEPRYPDRRTIPPAAETHHLFVENADDERYGLALTVVRPADDALVWRATYDAPDGRGFEIPDLFVEGRTYTIAADVEDGDRATTERSMEPCPHRGDSRNVGVWIEDGAISFVQDSCDEIIAGARVPVGNHESFVIE